MYDALIKKVNKKMAEMSWNLAMCTDTYRLNTLLNRFAKEMDSLAQEATEMVKELEGTHA